VRASVPRSRLESTSRVTFRRRLEGARELDVLAVKEERLLAPNGVKMRVRVLISCRGFPLNRVPLTYSVSSSCVPSFAPRLLSSHRAQEAPLGMPPYGVLPHLQERGATHLIRETGLDRGRPLVAFDVLERTDPSKKRDKSAASPIFKRVGDGDWQLFSAIDSCLSAGFYWRQQDYSDASYFVVLNFPVCVLSTPFWDVCIDEAKVGEPSLLSRGYQSNEYPDHRNDRTQAMVLFWTRDELSALVTGLDSLFSWLREEMKKPDLISRWPNVTNLTEDT
jgi:hypothetical protein